MSLSIVINSKVNALQLSNSQQPRSPRSSRLPSDASNCEGDRVLEQRLFKAIEEGDRLALMPFLKRSESTESITTSRPTSLTNANDALAASLSPGAVLQVLLTATLPNHPARIYYDTDVLQDAHALLGSRADRLNAMQIAIMLGDEEIALEILEFVAYETTLMNARKILLAFLGMTFGDGNTSLHLASFQGMAQLVSRLLTLGANTQRKNGCGYRPVDCADEDQTTMLFRQHGTNEPQISLPTKSPSLLSNGRTNSASTLPKTQSLPIQPSSFVSKNAASLVTPPKKKRPPVQFERYATLFDLIRYENFETVKEAIDRAPINVNYANELGKTLLHVCAERGRLDVLQYLVNDVALKQPPGTRTDSEIYRDPTDKSNEEDEDPEPPSSTPIRPAPTTFHNVYVDPRDHELWTPLHSAAAEEQLPIVQWLLETAGADFHARTGDGELPEETTENVNVQNYIKEFRKKAESSKT